MNTNEHTETPPNWNHVGPEHPETQQALSGAPVELRDFVGVRMPAERPTPITNAHSLTVNGINGWWVPEFVSKNLERQLAAKTEECVGWEQQFRELANKAILNAPGGPLSERPTPITDAIDADPANLNRGNANTYHRMMFHARDIERQLAEANEKIQGMKDGIDYATDALMREKTLADRLAEYLSRIDTLDCKDGPGGCWQASVAHEGYMTWKEARNVH